MFQTKTRSRRFTPSMDSLDKRDVPSSAIHRVAPHVAAAVHQNAVGVQPQAVHAQTFYHQGFISGTFGAQYTQTGPTSFHYDGYSNGTVVVNGVSEGACHIWGDLSLESDGHYRGNFAIQQTSGPYRYEVFALGEVNSGGGYGPYYYQDLGGNMTIIRGQSGQVDHEPDYNHSQSDIFNF